MVTFVHTKGKKLGAQNILRRETLDGSVPQSRILLTFFDDDDSKSFIISIVVLMSLHRLQSMSCDSDSNDSFWGCGLTDLALRSKNIAKMSNS